MLIFWSIAAGLTALALLFVAPPLLKKRTIEPTIDQNELNVTIFKDQLAELKTELEEGGLTPEGFEQAKQALEKNLLHELQEDNEPSAYAGEGRWAGAAVIILLPLAAATGYWFSSNPLLIFNPPPQNQKGAMPNLDEMVKRLAKRLESEPNNQEGWQMLARSYTVLERYPEASAAYAKAVSLSGEKDADLLVAYAESLAQINEQNLSGQPLVLLQKALSLDPKHQDGLWLAGMAAAQQQDYPQAIIYWERLLAQFPADSEASQTIQQHLSEVKQLAAKKPSETKPSETQN